MSCTIPLQREKPSSSDDGWQASLDLEICRQSARSVVSKSRQYGPLTIQAPFYPEGDICHLYLLHPPAGIVGGDNLQLTVATREKGSVLLTTPGATKFYRTNGKTASQNQHFTLASETTLEWLPQETIYFPGANAKMSTTIELLGNARYLGWEIHCLGLPANSQDFGEGSAEMRLFLSRDGQPLVVETLKITDEKRGYQAALLQNQPVFGSFIASGANKQLLSLLRKKLPQKIQGLWAATLVEDVLIVRYLGDSTYQARDIFTESWQLLRPHIVKRKPLLPRIWAT